MSTPVPETFLSGDAGDVTARRRRLKRGLGDLGYGLFDRLAGTGARLDRLAERQRPLRVLVLGIYRPASLMPGAVRELRAGRHELRIALGASAHADPELREVTAAEGLAGGKFENLNRLLASAPPPERFDWTLAIDDDVVLPDRFLDRFLALCQAFRLDLAQPAQTLLSHSAWKVTRRRPAVLLRQTRFVEIGPVTAFRAPVTQELLPFPELRFGWGLDLHWAALAAERSWRLGVVDATPVRHEWRLVASGYETDDAVSEAADFLAGRPYLPSSVASEVLAVHRRAPG